MAVVTRRTGLRADVIRSWERRHRAIQPARTAGNHRLYTDDEIRRLLLIRRALDSGWHIGQVASLNDAEIEEILEDVASLDVPPRREGRRAVAFEPFLSRCMERIERLDGEGLRRDLEAASVEFGRVQLLEGLLAPLMERVGNACANGSLRIAHEHLASAAVRQFLDSMRAAYPVSTDAPTIVVTTPALQHHELAAILITAMARAEGWQAVYLGPNLPAEEIAAATSQPGVRVLALSITFGASDPELEAELRKIGRLVPEEVGIVVGGRAAVGYAGALEAMDAVRIVDVGRFRDYLREERDRPR